MGCLINMSTDSGISYGIYYMRTHIENLIDHKIIWHGICDEGPPLNCVRFMK